MKTVISYVSFLCANDKADTMESFREYLRLTHTASTPDSMIDLEAKRLWYMRYAGTAWIEK